MRRIPMRQIPMKPFLGLTLAVCSLTGCARTPPPPLRPVAGSRLLMVSVIEPAADVVWDSVKTIVTLEATEEVQPRTEEEWLAVRNAAVVLAESGNLLMMGPRARDAGDWMRWSAELVDAGEAAMQAAEAHDPDAVFELGGRIYGSCTGCHEQYWAEGAALGPSGDP